MRICMMSELCQSDQRNKNMHHNDGNAEDRQKEVVAEARLDGIPQKDEPKLQEETLYCVLLLILLE